MGHKLPDHPRLGETYAAASRWANRLGVDHLGAEHIVLALAEVGGPATEELAEVGARFEDLRDAVLEALPESERKRFAPTHEEALEELGVDLSAVETALEETFGMRGLPLGRGLTATPQMVSLMALVEDHAERLGHTEILPEHLLLALIWHGKSFGMIVLKRFVSGSDLRRRILAPLDVEQDVRARYLEECERSERIAEERAAAGRRRDMPPWDTGAVEAGAPVLLGEGGAAAVVGAEALERLLAIAYASRFTVIDASAPADASYWVKVNPKLRQVFVAFCAVNAEGELVAVGVKNPGLVPWVDVRSWPGFPT